MALRDSIATTPGVAYVCVDNQSALDTLASDASATEFSRAAVRVTADLSRSGWMIQRVSGRRPMLASPATRPRMLKQNPALLPRLLCASTPAQPRPGCVPSLNGNCTRGGPRNSRMPVRDCASHHTSEGINGLTHERCGDSIAAALPPTETPIAKKKCVPHGGLR
jgi:hypothetical protein